MRTEERIELFQKLFQNHKIDLRIMKHVLLKLYEYPQVVGSKELMLVLQMMEYSIAKSFQKPINHIHLKLTNDSFCMSECKREDREIWIYIQPDTTLDEILFCFFHEQGHSLIPNLLENRICNNLFINELHLNSVCYIYPSGRNSLDNCTLQDIYYQYQPSELFANDYAYYMITKYFQKEPYVDLEYMKELSKIDRLFYSNHDNLSFYHYAILYLVGDYIEKYHDTNTNVFQKFGLSPSIYEQEIKGLIGNTGMKKLEKRL